MPPDTHQSIDQALEYEAVALFRQQARTVRPRFEITEENRAAVVMICRRLDGLPLAIEIAAARVKMLTPQALLKRLDQSLNLLVGGAVDLPDRQQTLRRTIDWSYELLEPEEQIIFTRLGIFSGGFTLDAAEEICNPTGEIDVFSGIEALLNNSLLRQVQSVSDEPRFDMLQTIREYALEKAAEAGITADCTGRIVAITHKWRNRILARASMALIRFCGCSAMKKNTTISARLSYGLWTTRKTASKW